MTSLTPRIDKLEYNWLINGTPRIYQRGDISASPVAITDYKYSADRWTSRIQTVTANVQSFTTNQPADFPSGTSLRYTATSTASGYIGCIQYVEDYALLQGRQVTFGAWVKSNNVNARLLMYDGNFTASTSHSGGGAWEYLTLTATVGNSISSLRFYALTITEAISVASLSTNDYIEFTGASVVEGTINGFHGERIRSLNDELELCKRYYQKSYKYNTDPGSVETSSIVRCAGVISGGATYLDGWFPFEKEMRVAPTLRTWSYNATPALGYVTTRNTSGALTDRLIGATNIGTKGFSISQTTSDPMMLMYYDADAEF